MKAWGPAGAVEAAAARVVNVANGAEAGETGKAVFGWQIGAQGLKLRKHAAFVAVVARMRNFHSAGMSWLLHTKTQRSEAARVCMIRDEEERSTEPASAFPGTSWPGESRECSGGCGSHKAEEYEAEPGGEGGVSAAAAPGVTAATVGQMAH